MFNAFFSAGFVFVLLFIGDQNSDLDYHICTGRDPQGQIYSLKVIKLKSTPTKETLNSISSNYP
jgi:hypothetical protein